MILDRSGFAGMPCEGARRPGVRRAQQAARCSSATLHTVALDHLTCATISDSRSTFSGLAFSSCRGRGPKREWHDGGPTGGWGGHWTA